MAPSAENKFERASVQQKQIKSPEQCSQATVSTLVQQRTFQAYIISNVSLGTKLLMC